VVFDTAPTGHTLRLLQLPAAWNQYLDTNTSGTSCLGPLSGLRDQHDLYIRTLACLRDAAQTQIALVSRAEHSALREAERTRLELAGLGLVNIRLFLNGLFDADDNDPVAQALAQRQNRALSRIPEGLYSLDRTDVPLLSFNVTGLDAVRAIRRPTLTVQEVADSLPDDSGTDTPPLSDLVREIEARGRGVVLTMGKGGVGKTTIAAAIALQLAKHGHRVHLTTTDPAAHIEHALGESVPNLEISRIDPLAETEAYRREVMASSGAGLDEAGRQLLEEDLHSPCTEEIAVFRAFAAKVDKGRDGFVVLDTAPTGHTLLLLDATEAYHREVSRTQSELPEVVRQLLPRLRDPEFSKVILVTLPEATPVQQDLKRAGIQPFAWVVNQSLTPLALTHRMLKARRGNEHRYIQEARNSAKRFAVVPWLAKEPVGIEGLEQLMADPERVCCGVLSGEEECDA
jgi:arsenite-transporting ATPase